ncbi:MAG TPA: hypothetical protein PLP33_27840 [Leptospiraceae bacterium]|nr:hypothetical protein [Leptospiraceae bacterium]
MANKSYLNEAHKIKNDYEDYADPVNKRFYISTSKDLESIISKIRRLSGRDEIRKNAIKIAVRKRLNIPDSLLGTWSDVSMPAENAEFKYIPTEERNKIPDADFGYVKGERRLFPVRNQEDLDAASHLIGRAKGLNEKDRERVIKKLKLIAKRKDLEIPESWNNES